MSEGPAVAHRPHVRRPAAPRGPRRVSGPARSRVRTAPGPAARKTPRTLRAHAGAVALPPVVLPTPGLGRALDAARRLPDNRWLDRLLRGQGWIVLIGLALIGIVFLQVSLLKMNARIGQAVEHTASLERQNADLRADVSRLSSEERIQQVAGDLGLIMPAAGDVRYLKVSSADADARRAAATMRAPNDPAELAAIEQSAATTAAAPAANAIAPGGTVAAEPTAAPVTAPTTTATPAATPAAAPTDEHAAVATTAPSVTGATPATGATAAGTGE